MNRFYLSKLAFLVVMLSGWSLGARAQSVTFSYTGAAQSYTVPAGVTSIAVDMMGANGGTGYSGYGNGGKGGRLTGTLSVTPGQVLSIYVGGRGGDAPLCCTYGIAGGFNGGGNSQFYYGASGGGGTDIRIGGVGLSNRVMVAGGGGGAGWGCSYTHGGDGGGLTGANGQYCSSPTYSTSYNGYGGTQTAGGANGTGGCNSAGSLGQGGLGSSCIYAGGGGGGYYGGGGGYYAGGGGGSSYANTTFVSGAAHTQGFNSSSTGHGSVTLCPGPNTGAIVGTVTDICPGTSLTLTNPTAAPGGIWSSANSTVSVNPSTGVVTGISQGTATVTFSVTNACATGSIFYSVNINPLPAPIVNPINVCQGATMTLTDADAGGSWVSGNTALATIGSASGIVTGVSAGSPNMSYILPTGCMRTTVISVNALPTAYAVTGTGNYCAGGSGLPVGITASSIGISYQLYNGSTPVFSPVIGAGPAINFGTVTSVGTYSVQATDPSSSCARGMTGVATIGINPLPTASNVTGGGHYCAGSTGVPVGVDASISGISYQLYRGPAAIGAPVVGTGSAFNFGAYTTDGVYTVKATNTSTSCINTMTGSVSVITDALPNIYTVTDGGSYCAGGSGQRVGLSGSSIGINYQLYVTTTSGTTTVGAPMPGTGAPLVFGTTFTTAGTYWVKATNATTSCQVNMAGSVDISISSLPDAYAVRDGGAYCVGGSGAPVSLNYSTVGVNYQLLLGGVPVSGVGPVAGMGAPINFGMQTAAGNYTVRATNATTGCTSMMSGSATVNIVSLPATHNVTGGGHYCAGLSGMPVNLATSTAGVSYQLYADGVITGGPVFSTGAPISFGNQTIGANYTVVATNATGCTQNMTGSANVVVDPLPTAHGVVGGGSYCAGSTGVHVGLIASTIGISYQLYYGTIPGAILLGTGSMLDFGARTAAGSYTIVGTDLATSCVGNMAGNAVITVNPLPAVFTVTGGGGYCEGGTGAPVGLSFSNSGVNYQWYFNAIPVAAPASGLDAPLDFGLRTDSGIYTAVATNAITGCVSNMSGSARVTINPLPNEFTVTGGGSYCQGGAGVRVRLSGSTFGIRYQLYNDGTPSGFPVTGTGAAIDFGMKTNGGNYTVIATNPATGCVKEMSTSVSITVNPLPTLNTVSGGGSYCTGGSGVPVGLAGSEGGTIEYKLYRNGSYTGISALGTGTMVDFSNQTIVGDYTVMATNTITSCAVNMSGSARVATLALPIAYTVTGGGSFCAGAPGARIGLDATTNGISYQLKLAGTDVGAPIIGAGRSIDFGLQTAAGVYTVAAINPSTTCANNMVSSATIVVNAAPAVDTVSGTGSYCAGGVGVPVNLGGSVSGVRYQLFLDRTAIGYPSVGTGSALSFGTRTAAGVYTVVATNPFTTCTSAMFGDATVSITPTVVPAVTLSSSISSTVCAGTSGVYTATPVNGGTAPTYQWTVNGLPVGTGADTLNYTPANGDVVKAVLTSNATCASPLTADDRTTVTVMANGTPAVAITTSTNDSICVGTQVLYTAIPTLGGTSASLVWKKNGVVVGTGYTYSNLVPANGDNVNVTLHSSYACRTIDSAVSANNLLTVLPYNNPTVTITAAPGDHIYIGQRDTLTATVTNGGSNPTYQWQINGVDVPGATTNKLIRNNFANGDVVTCNVVSSGLCGGLSAGKDIMISVKDPTGVKQITTNGSDIAIVPNPNKGAFTIKGTFAATTDQEVMVTVTNMVGQVVYSGRVMTQNGNINEKVQLNSGIANGMYILNLVSGNEQSVFHIVIEQ